MELHSYDEESVKGLLDWAQDLLDSQKYPTGKFTMNKCTVILDCKHFLVSMIAMITRNWENPTFHPTIEELWEFRKQYESIGTNPEE
ncbi:DUF6965 family protein [Bacteroides reticulotermitis]|uniref:DUF6965 domain-containing protein n=2 Tax=Bacteroides reticulotermitis TaxID=1133319 RepID=W4UUI8_9BACE|nr:hypothetical protein [Bacteroides reticulotermitis]MBB4043186.1 hypothetical protein [Bacteroides reticulotermitis]GAE84288.1 hypothetical protein JCM10512_2622 [Bacteroides reticulotermitis JCM 10512]